MEWQGRGIILAGLGCALFAAGIWRVDGVMASMGVAAVLLLWLGKIAGRRNVLGVEAGLDVERRIESGKGAGVRLKIMRKSLVDGFRLRCGVRLMGEKTFSARVAWMRSGGVEVVEETGVVFQKRGLVWNHEGWIESDFPLGLFRFQKDFKIQAEIGVRARSIVPGCLRATGFSSDGMILEAGSRADGAGEWRGLREWRAGDGRGRIARAASARSEAAGRGPMVREEDPPGERVSKCLVIMHSHGGEGALIRPDRFELALSVLTGAVLRLHGAGIPVRWKADFDGWTDRVISSPQDLGSLKEIIMSAVRCGGTEAHELEGMINGRREGETVMIISDMPVGGWAEILPKGGSWAIAIDPGNYYKGRGSAGKRVAA